MEHVGDAGVVIGVAAAAYETLSWTTGLVPPATVLVRRHPVLLVAVAVPWAALGLHFVLAATGRDGRAWKV